MLELDGVIDAYFGEQVQILVSAPGKLDGEKAKEILTEKGFKTTSIVRAESI